MTAKCHKKKKFSTRLRIILRNVSPNSLASLSSLCLGLSYALYVTQERRRVRAASGKDIHLLLLSSTIEINHFKSLLSPFLPLSLLPPRLPSSLLVR